MTRKVPVYCGLDADDRQRLVQDIVVAYRRAAAAISAADESEAGADTIGPTSGELVEVPQFTDLIGIDPSVYRQINAALAAGKQHLMFYGPPRHWQDDPRSTGSRDPPRHLHDDHRLGGLGFARCHRWLPTGW